MSEYISKNEACQELREARCCDMTDKWGQGYNAGITEAIDRINNFIPPADVVPVVHGHWEQKGWFDNECSICHKHYPGTYKFCPNCGAKMGEEDNSEN